MNNKNNVYCKFTYKCGICGNEFNNVLDRAKCEIACSEKAEAEAKKAAEAKKKEEQATRKAEVDFAFEALHKLMTTYVKDYGSYEYTKGDDKSHFHWSSGSSYRLW